MLLTWTSQKIEIYKDQVSNIKGAFSLPTLSKVDKGTLLTLPNTRCVDIISKYQHLKGVEMEDTDIKPKLPTHVILGLASMPRLRQIQQQGWGSHENQ